MLELLKKRKSVRNFKADAVEKEKLINFSRQPFFPPLQEILIPGNSLQ